MVRLALRQPRTSMGAEARFAAVHGAELYPTKNRIVGYLGAADAHGALGFSGTQQYDL